MGVNIACGRPISQGTDDPDLKPLWDSMSKTVLKRTEYGEKALGGISMNPLARRQMQQNRREGLSNFSAPNLQLLNRDGAIILQSSHDAGAAAARDGAIAGGAATRGGEESS